MAITIFDPLTLIPFGPVMSSINSPHMANGPNLKVLKNDYSQQNPFFVWKNRLCRRHMSLLRRANRKNAKPSDCSIFSLVSWLRPASFKMESASIELKIGSALPYNRYKRLLLGLDQIIQGCLLTFSDPSADHSQLINLLITCSVRPFTLTL